MGKKYKQTIFHLLLEKGWRISWSSCCGQKEHSPFLWCTGIVEGRPRHQTRTDYPSRFASLLLCQCHCTDHDPSPKIVELFIQLLKRVFVEKSYLLGWLTNIMSGISLTIHISLLDSRWRLVLRIWGQPPKS